MSSEGRTEISAAMSRLAANVLETAMPAVVLDDQARYVYVNRAYEQLAGKPRDELLGRCMWEVFPDAASPELKFWTVHQLVQRDRIPAVFEEYYPPMDLWVEVDLYPVGDTNLAAFYRRINRRKQAEAQLRESETRFRQLAETLPQLVWIIRVDGSVDYVNQHWCDYMGMTLAQGADWLQSVHPDDREATRQRWQTALQTGQAYSTEYRLRRACDGAYRWFLAQSLPVREDGGHIVRWLGTATDVQEQKDATERLRQLNQRQNEFMAMLSHELRNPLAPIRNSIYILERAVPGDEQARRAREVIDRQTHHLNRLVDDLLDVTRISRGKIRLQRECIDLQKVVYGVAEDHREQFASNGVDLQVQVPAHGLRVLGDATRLAQAVGNLLSNAVKFTLRGGLTLLTLTSDADQAVIGVQDTGLGIEPEVLPRLFEPFVQSDQTLNRSRGGLGLGLALVKGLVELHGGTVEAFSAGLGHGAEFVIRIPLHDSEPRAQVSPPAAAHELHRRVLVIEDNPDAAQSLKEVIELIGHTVEVAHSGAEGIDLARRFAPDVVLCDIGLPGVNGYEVARALRDDASLNKVVLVALTGYANSEDRELAMASGFDAHLAKPADLPALEAILAQAQPEKLADSPRE